VLGDDEIQRMTEPTGYLGECEPSVDRVVGRQQGWLEG